MSKLKFWIHGPGLFGSGQVYRFLILGEVMYPQ